MEILIDKKTLTSCCGMQKPNEGDMKIIFMLTNGKGEIVHKKEWVNKLDDKCPLCGKEWNKH